MSHKVSRNEALGYRTSGGKVSFEKKEDETEEKRAEKIKIVAKVIKDKNNVDVCFLVDCTASMRPWIEEVKNKVKAISNRVNKIYKGCDFKYSFVRYTDFDQEKSVSKFDFSDDLDNFQDFVGSIVAKSGNKCDVPEDVLSGLETVMKLEWRERSTKVLIHIGDAPNHGRIYHNLSCRDNYIDGDPKNRTHKESLDFVVEKKIFYFFGYIYKEDTDKMIDVFNQYLKEKKYNQLISQMDLHSEMRVEQEVVLSLQTSIESSKTEATSVLHEDEDEDEDEDGKDSSDSSDSNDSDEDNNNNDKNDNNKKGSGVSQTMRKYIPENTPEKWWEGKESVGKSFTGSFTVKTFAIPSCVYTITNDLFIYKSSDQKIQFRINPFAVGGVRAAYRAITMSDHEEIVLKMYKSVKKGANKKVRYEHDLKAHVTAAFYCEKFCSFLDKSSNTPEITYLVAQLVMLKKNQGFHMNASIEKYIKDGKYQKFNNNSGGVWLDLPYSEILQAFSHFSWVYSNYRHLVVDVQGWVIGKKIILTDPVVHARKNLLGFGRTNMGEEGIKFFMDSHECGETCKKLGLDNDSFFDKFPSVFRVELANQEKDRLERKKICEEILKTRKKNNNNNYNNKNKNNYKNKNKN